MEDFTKTLGTKVDDQTYRDFTEMAKKLGISNSDLLRKAIANQFQLNKNAPTSQSNQSNQNNKINRTSTFQNHTDKKKVDSEVLPLFQYQKIENEYNALAALLLAGSVLFIVGFGLPKLLQNHNN